ncbi:hypothetical protein CH275_17665 [Rhodococcus sp. 06-235-1A]|uniref:hypothetical protein n=1 Tax=Rhodococcus sp. 06-235-1A TaxID=2022508 RepID=UPI000B9A3A51|nr:hypothetical protein [Rhodococcus sp. 06-235-1A]OZD02448.1 hypothetical protein CH275_17665 [Rhodococcus sp. 06-235-1A]
MLQKIVAGVALAIGGTTLVALTGSGAIVSDVVFDGVTAIAAGRVEATGTSQEQPTTIEFVVSDGRWKLERSTACALTGAC